MFHSLVWGDIWESLQLDTTPHPPTESLAERPKNDHKVQRTEQNARVLW